MRSDAVGFDAAAGFDLVIRGATVVTPGHSEAADIGISGGRIVQLGGTMAGIEELVERLDEHREHILAAGQLEERRRRNLHNEVLAIATARMRRRLEEELREDAEFKRLLEEVVQRRLDPASAATTLLERGV